MGREEWLAAVLLAEPWTEAGLLARYRAGGGPSSAWARSLVRRTLRTWPRPPTGMRHDFVRWLAADWRVAGDPETLSNVTKCIEAGWSTADIVALVGHPRRTAAWIRALRAGEVLAGMPADPDDLDDDDYDDYEIDDFASRLDVALATGACRRPIGLSLAASMGPAFGEVDRPPLPTTGDLAAWLGLSDRHLQWHADLPGHERHARDRLRHYRYHWIPKATGGQRLLEIPKHRHAGIQRRILDAILRPLAPHPAAHAFRTGGTVRGFVEPHVGQAVVVRVDLANFFASVPLARITGVFQALGYPYPVARLLRGLTTNSAPRAQRPPTTQPNAAEYRRAWWHRQQLAHPHLPQGACTSPALANLCARALDVRLTALAQRYGARYSRYADDLAFSGGALGHRLGAFITNVRAIVRDEGFAVNTRKLRVMRAGGRQRLAGVVVNERPNVTRTDFDRLKATLHNCARHGPASQNRADHPEFRAQLRGRVAWVAHLNPARGAKLLALFDAIDWG